MGKTREDYEFPQKSTTEDVEQEGTERITFGIEIGILDIVDHIANDSGMFTSRNDFIYSAVRAYYLEYLPEATEKLYELAEEYAEHPARALDEYAKYAREYCDNTIQKDRNEYLITDKKKKQVSIYVPKSMSGMIESMEELSPNDDSKIVLAAIYHYLRICMDFSTSVTGFTLQYNELHLKTYGPKKSTKL